jgi:peptide methionine sulfoxide reductase MsrB
MQARVSIQCAACGQRLGRCLVDTADMPEELQQKVNSVILAHRQECPYYRQKEVK